MAAKAAIHDNGQTLGAAGRQSRTASSNLSLNTAGMRLVVDGRRRADARGGATRP